MKKTALLVCCVILLLVSAVAAADSTWTCTSCGQTGNTNNYCPYCGSKRPSGTWNCQICGKKGNTGNYCVNCGSQKYATASTEVYGLAIQKLAVNAGPGTKRYFKELGTYNLAGQYIQILAKAWDPNNDIWWVKVVLPNRDSTTGWTGYKRFDPDSFNLDDVPTEYWEYKK